MDRGADPPAQLGGFLLQAELGRGGMGVVYRAYDPRLSRPVALKVVLGAGTPEERARLQAEAAAAARLDHPNIVRVLSAGEDRGRPFLAFELVEGQTLAGRLAREGPLAPRRAARLIGSLARGVQHAHERGVIHRDIKPANVLLAGDTPRLADFGLARSGARHLTQTGAVMGTPEFMSPEQAGGEVDAVGTAADIYGLGATLFAALTGRPPFTGASAINTMRQVLLESAPSLRGDGVPRDLDAIVQRCLDKAPERRFASAEELARALDGWLAGAGRAGGRRRLGAGVGVGVGLLAAVVLAAVALASRDAPSPPTPTPPPVALPDPAPSPADAVAATPRDAAGQPPPPLAFEQAYLEVETGRAGEALEALIRVIPALTGLEAARAQALLALAAARRTRWDEAEAAGRAALAAAPADPLVLRLAGLAELDRARVRPDAAALPRARGLFERALAAGDLATETHALARAALRLRDRGDLEELVERHASPTALRLLAGELAYQEPRDWPRALALVTRAAAQAPDDARGLTNLANLEAGWLQYHMSADPRLLAAEAGLGAVERIDDALGRALALAPEDPVVLADAAYVQRIVGEQFARARAPEDARARCERARDLDLRALSLFPGLFRARLELVECQAVLEGPEAALDAAEPLLRAYPDQHLVHYARYKSLHQLRRYDDALAAIEEAHRFAPEHPDFGRMAEQLRRALRSR